MYLHINPGSADDRGYITHRPSNLARDMIVHDRGNVKVACCMEGCQYKGKNYGALERIMRRHKTLLECPVSGCGRYASTKNCNGVVMVNTNALNVTRVSE